MRRHLVAVAIVVIAIVLAACGASQSKKAGTSTSTSTSTGAGSRDVQIGMATWYATGTMTASGERFDKNAMTAAHRTLPFGSIVRVTHRRSGKAVTVRINDRGPFGSKKRIIDVSKGAARKLGMIDEGVAPVKVEILSRPAKRSKKRPKKKR